MIGLVIAGVLSSGCNTTTGTGVRADANDEVVWAALAQGGKVLLFRHGEVQRGPGYGDSMVRDESCVRERNLSATGRRQFTRIGEAFAARGIRVDEVLASPFCRTRDSAERAFGRFEVREFLSLSEILPESVAQDAALEAAEVIGNYQGEGNLVLVTHEPNVVLISQRRVGFAEAVVLEPQGGPFFEVIGILRP
jgi:phosphohistidine phosphatase SixA